MALNTMFDRMREIRNSKKYTKKKMADIFGCTTASYSRYENGERELGIKSLLPVYYMGINLNWLITGEGDMELDTNMVSDNIIIKSLTDTVEKQANALDTANKTNENLSNLLIKRPHNDKECIFETFRKEHSNFNFEVFKNKVTFE